MRALRWTTKSTAHLADELTAQGHRCSARTAAKLLKLHGVQPAGQRQDDRRAPASGPRCAVPHINAQVTAFQAAGEPVISVDTKKKELVGDYERAAGSGERPASPGRSHDHDFPDRSSARSRPTASTTSPPTTAGSMSASTTTPPSSRSRRSAAGGTRSAQPGYPAATRLLITADAAAQRQPARGCGRAN